MRAFYLRLCLILRISWGGRALIIEIQFDKHRKKDKLTMWGTETDRVNQVDILRKMADSIEIETRQNLRKFQPKSN